MISSDSLPSTSERDRDFLVLSALVSTAEKDNQFFANLAQINTVAGAKIYFQLYNAAYGSVFPEITFLCPINTIKDVGLAHLIL
jgi:hypothetical protein